jgi:hypothetical protein
VTPVFGKSVFDNHQTVFTASFARILLVRVERLINGPLTARFRRAAIKPLPLVRDREENAVLLVPVTPH